MVGEDSSSLCEELMIPPLWVAVYLMLDLAKQHFQISRKKRKLAPKMKTTIDLGNAPLRYFKVKLKLLERKTMYDKVFG